MQVLNCLEIKSLIVSKIFDIPKHENINIHIKEYKIKRVNLVPNNIFSNDENKLLVRDIPNLVRCTKCLLPHTFPFIKFNQNGVCNYCLNHKTKSKPKPKEDLFKILENIEKK